MAYKNAFGALRIDESDDSSAEQSDHSQNPAIFGDDDIGPGFENDEEELSFDNEDAQSSAGFSVVSCRATDHALNRMLERSVTTQEIKEAKVSGLITLHFSKNDWQDAERWVVNLKEAFTGLDGIIIPWHPQVAPVNNRY